MSRPVSLSTCAFLGRRCGCGAGGHSVSNTGPEGPVLAAVRALSSFARSARFRREIGPVALPPGSDSRHCGAGEGRA